MAGSSSASSTTVEASQLNVGEVLLAIGHSSIRRARLLASAINDVVSGRKPIDEAGLELLDGNESDLEELTLRWRLAGVRWPILILVLLGFVAGYNTGRRAPR